MNNKHYIYRVYRNGVYKGAWGDDVLNDFDYSQEINSTGSAITVILGRPADSYGEGTDIDFNNTVKIYVVDDEAPNGQLIFQGYISSYKPVFDNSERVEVEIVGFGATLENYMIETGEVVDVNQNSQNANSNYIILAPKTTEGRIIQSFTVGAGITKQSSIEFKLGATSSYDIGTMILCEVFTSLADAQNTGSPNLLVSASVAIDSLSPTSFRFSFATSATVTPGAVYYARLRSTTMLGSGGSGTLGGGIKVYYDNTAPYSGGTLYVNQSGSWVNTGFDAYIKTYQASGNTTAPFASVDPSAILRTIIDNYNAQGGEITYTPSSIDNTNSTVTYQFNTNTVLEGVNKCLTLAPPGWYWYIDQANNVLHFHKIASRADHEIVLGKHIQNLSVEKRTQELANIIYFVGGPTGGVNLFLKTVLQTSVDIYGRRAIRITDRNVTSSATAIIISNSYLTNKGQVTLRVDLDILDNGGQASSILGFNIESLTLGQMITLFGFGPKTAVSLWDVALWDVAKWDFDITDLSSLIIQITRLDYSPDKVHLSLSTTPPDVTKRIEDIKRNLDQTNTLNNPVAPS